MNEWDRILLGIVYPWGSYTYPKNSFFSSQNNKTMLASGRRIFSIGRRQRHFCSTSTSTSHKLVDDLIGIVSSSNVDVSEVGREQHGHDESWHTWKKPAVVIHPRSTEEVSECVKLCSSENVRMVPFGTGTGLEGGTNLGSDAVCFNLTTNMNEILRVNAEDFDVSHHLYLSTHFKQTHTYINHTVYDTSGCYEAWFE